MGLPPVPRDGQAAAVKKKIDFALHAYAGVNRASGTRKETVEEHFQEYFGRNCVVTPDGRTAIRILLESLGLRHDDEVYITTTFGKGNVSACVTASIFNYCKPARILSGMTKAIFVIHEFGVPHPRMPEFLRIGEQMGVPVIEDCAHAIDSRLDGQLAGTLGDYAICSLSKIFPVECGGLLVGGNFAYRPSGVQRSKIEQVRNNLPPYLGFLGEYAGKKRRNFLHLKSGFSGIPLAPLFELTEDISPSFHFPLVSDRFEEVLEATRRAGIDSAVWHGSNIVILPQHQFLTVDELEFIVQVVGDVYRN